MKCSQIVNNPPRLLTSSMMALGIAAFFLVVGGVQSHATDSAGETASSESVFINELTSVKPAKTLEREGAEVLKPISAVQKPEASSYQSCHKALQQTQLLRDLEATLNGIQSLQAKFYQYRDLDSDGNIPSIAAEGTFSILRPVGLRFDYTVPHGDIIIADGKTLHYWDNEMEQHSRATIKDTLAEVLLKPEIDLENMPKVVTMIERRDRGVTSGDNTMADPRKPKADVFLSLTYQDTPYNEAAEGEPVGEPVSVETELTLHFVCNSGGLWGLSGWQVIDTSGELTKVSLYDTVTNAPVDPKIFKFEDPSKNKAYPQKQ